MTKITLKDSLITGFKEYFFEKQIIGDVAFIFFADASCSFVTWSRESGKGMLLSKMGFIR